MKIIAIISPPYSGSTLLTYLLATHPQIATLGEGQKFYSKVLREDNPRPGSKQCSCGQTFSNCPFWQSVKSQVIKQVSPSIRALNFTKFRLYKSFRLNRLAHQILFPLVRDKRTHLIPPFLRQRYRAVCQANHTFIQAVCQQKQASVYLDGTKDITNTIYQQGCDCFEVLVVRLVRDGRAQTYSHLNRHPHRDMTFAARKWQETVNEQNELLEASNLPHIRLSYEQLCQTPQKALNTIFEAVDLDPSQGSLQFRDFENHILGNYQMRFSSLDEIRDKRAWKQGLSQGQLQTFEQTAGSLNTALGYR